MDGDKMSNRYRGPSIDACYHVSVHLAREFGRRILKCEKLTDDRRRTLSDDKSSHCLCQGEPTRIYNFHQSLLLNLHFWLPIVVCYLKTAITILFSICDIIKIKTRGSQEPVIAHLVFNLTSKVDRNGGEGGVTHNFESGSPKIISTQISEQKIFIS